jgi:branched-chain amino acid transport system substrate-binding protein
MKRSDGFKGFDWLMILLSLILIVSLAGCLQPEKPAATPTPVSTPTQTPATPSPTPTPTPEKIKLRIGVLVPVTGKFQTAGVVMKNAALLAEKHLEEGGKLDIELEFADCGDSAEKTKAAFLDLANRGVVAIVGAYASPQAIAAADAAKETETIYIVSVGSAGIIEKMVADGNVYVFRNAYNTTYWGILASEFLKLSKANAYYFQGFQPLSTFNKGMLNVIQQKSDLELVDEVYYNPAVDPKDVQNKAIEAAKKVGERDVLVLGDPGGLSVPFLKTYRANGGKGIVYSVGGVLALPQTLKSLNKTADYTAFQAAALEKIPLTEYTEKYFEGYRNEFGEEANNYAGVLTYDAILILGQAAERAGNDKAALIEELEKGEFKGACGVYEFNTKHQALWGSEKLVGKIAEWVNGETLILYPSSYAESEVLWP